MGIENVLLTLRGKAVWHRSLNKVAVVISTDTVHETVTLGGSPRAIDFVTFDRDYKVEEVL